jgi:TonB family protein
VTYLGSTWGSICLQAGRVRVRKRKFDFLLRERIERRATITLTGALFFISIFSFVFPAALRAQKIAKSDRKVLVSVKPDYSELLRHAQIGGVVRLKATVSADGKVLNVEVMGGNPILAESAVSAVKGWKYAPAASQTVEDVSISFTPH